MNRKTSMLKIVLAAGAASLLTHSVSGAFAEAVINYQSGTGFVPGYTLAASALGEPSRVTPGEFGGPVEPFNAPYLKEQVVSLGEGGSLTVRLEAPAVNLASNPFGRDFTIFGNAGFVYSDFNAGITDGSLYGGNGGTTRVSVSGDGATFYTLSTTAMVDGLYPTDGAGDFSRVVDPSLSAAAFAGKNVDGIRALYAGSGGGTSFDLAWAVDAQNQPVVLDSINYVRVEVLSGVAEIDGFAVVPEPGTIGLLAVGMLAIFGLRSARAEKRF